MRVPEVAERFAINLTVKYINRYLNTEPPDMEKILEAVRNGQWPSHSTLLEPSKDKQNLISETVEPFNVTLIYPQEGQGTDIFIKSHCAIPKIDFRDEDGGAEISPIDLCIGLTQNITWNNIAYVVAKGNVFAVSPRSRQTIDFSSNSENVEPETVYVNKAFPNEALAVAKLARKTLYSYRRRQR
jgi:hypothetical protein